MRRRQFLSFVGGAAAWPLAARAQQQSKLPTIGFLGTPTASAWVPHVTAFEKRLRELGWIEGRTVAIEYRWAGGRSELFGEIAAEFVRRKVDIIVTSGAAVPQAKDATADIPIVFAVANDPIGTGLVAGLARPGGNVTGLSLQSADLASKRLELLREVVPAFRRFAILGDIGYPASVLEIGEAREAARSMGLEATTLEIRRAEDIAPAFETIKSGTQALYVCGANPVVNSNRVRINALALAGRLPTVHSNKEYLEADGMMSYGADVSDLFRRAAEYADKILHGVKPGDLPVEQLTKFDLVINLAVAKSLGLAISTSFLLRADEVIE